MNTLPVTIPVDDDFFLEGNLALPDGARGMVVFAHGDSSSRQGPRNRHVAAVLQRAGFATLLLDLLTDDEEHAEQTSRHLRFDVGILATRLLVATRWLGGIARIAALPVGYIGTGTGAAAALVAAARAPGMIAAVVSRGGRPDLAGGSLIEVGCPVLLVVGGADRQVLALNRAALAALPDGALQIVPGATHLFEEPGALDMVARVSADWFTRHLVAQPEHRPAL